MTQEKRRVAGELAAWHLCGVVMCVTGAALNPQTLNPYGTRKADSPALARIKAASAAIGWRVMTSEHRAN